jgi:hypothetical protein
MIKVPGTGNRGAEGFTAGADLTVSDLFTILWDALADLLGTAATAALLKRAARRAVERSPELAMLIIRREELAYGYSCPSGWSAKASGAPPALRDLVEELRPLLIEMTGQIVVQHLEHILELREQGLFAPREEPK